MNQKDYKHKAKRLGNIKPVLLPVIGSEFEADGHVFLISDIKQKEENGNYVAICVAESALISFSITMSSKLPLFKLDE